MVNDPEEINTTDCLTEPVKEMARHDETVLVRVKISHAEYIEKVPEKLTAIALMNQMKNKIFRWFHLHILMESRIFRKYLHGYPIHLFHHIQVNRTSNCIKNGRLIFSAARISFMPLF